MKVLKYDHQEFYFNEKLTEEQQTHFFKYGFIQFKHFLSREKVASIISELRRIEQEWLAQGVEKINGIPLKFGKDEHGALMIQRMCFTNKYSPVLADLLRDTRLRAFLELLHPYEGRVSEDEKDGLILNHYINQPNSKFTQMGWHTDNPRDLFLGQRILPMLNIGIHLDDCPIENGGLRVLPGTHKQNTFQLLFRKKPFIDHRPDPQEVGFNIDAGDLTIHFGSVWHRVQVSPYYGEKSRRRVMYVPIITGKYMPKHERSRTPFYHRFAHIVQK
jgi:phytanoyl-CoA hydroxylase